VGNQTGRTMVQMAQFALLLAALITLSVVVARSHGEHHSGTSTAGRFDYYLMSLSWSPSYCLVHPDESEQCGRRGFGFVLHGLWPQNSNGSWPQHCDSSASPDAATIARALAFMPSRHLIDHEWQTHGACTGLDPHAYFELADRAFARVRIPAELATPRSPPEMSADDIERRFMDANPGLGENMLSVVCHEGGELAEVRVCLDKDLSPQACAGRTRNSCRYGSLRIPAAR